MPYFIILSLLIFLNTTASSASNTELEKVTLQLKWKHQFQFAGFYMAKEMGFYEENGLEVEFKELQKDTDIVREVTNGNSTYGLSDSAIVLSVLKNKNITILSSIFENSPIALAVLKSSNIDRVEKLKGKTIMMPSSTSENASIMAMLKSFDINVKNTKIIPTSLNIQDLIDKKTDAFSIYVTNQPFLLDEKNIKYNLFSPKDFGYDFYGDILFTSKDEASKNSLKTKKFVDASIKGWKYAFENIDRTVDLILEKYNTQNFSKEALLFQAYNLKKLSNINSINYGKLNIDKIKNIINIYSILGLSNTNINIENFIFNQSITNLSQKDIEYIQNNKFKCITTNNWEPFNTYKDDFEKPIGIALDYMNIIKQSTGLQIECEVADKWTDVIEAIKSKKADITLSTTVTDEWKEFAIFSDPYASYPIALATGKEISYISDLNLLENKAVAVGKNFSTHRILKKHYPNLNLVPVKNIDEALHMLSNGKVYAVADILPVLAYKINKYGYLNLKISGTAKINFDVMMMTNKENQQLISIINKAINSISEDQKKLIENKWISVNVEQKPDYKIIWQLSFVFAVIFLILYLRHKQLKIYNKELLKAKQNLKESIESFEILLNSTIEGIIIFEEGKCIDANDVAVKLFDFDSKEQIIGKEVLSFIAESSKNTVKQKFKEENVVSYEADISRKDGSTFPALVRGKNLTLNGKKIRVSAFIDLSDLKEKENIILQQSKMAALGEMIGNIAHQWRQPLNVISLGATGLKINKEYGTLNDEVFYETCEKIFYNAQYLSNTIDDFKNFIKGEHKLEKIDTNELVNKTMNIVEGSLKSQEIKLVLDIPEKFEINCYPNELVQCFINIINNSKDAFEDSDIENRFIFLKIEPRTHFINFEIKDNAGGIKEDIITKIFEPYFTTKHQSRGTGLGLHMTYNLIVKGMNGSVNASNEEFEYKDNFYKGARFTITLPLS